MLASAAVHAAPANACLAFEKAGGRGLILSELRQAIGRIEKKYAGLPDEATAVPLGIAPLDAALGGGLARSVLHEITAESEPHSTAAFGFALILAARAAPARPVLFVGEDMAALESGALYGLALDDIALAPERLILVRAARTADVLWAMEEALRCRALAAVIAEFRTAERIDDVAVRRLSLAAGKQQALAFLLHAVPQTPLAAATRFVIASASSASAPHAIGPPAFRVDLVRNRFGPNGSWLLEWNSAGQRFDLTATDREPVAAAALDRPRRAGAA
jgi:protein ImuA